MTQSTIVAPEFKLRFFAPQYWPTWLGVVFLFSVSWLPYALQWQIGKGLGWLLSKLAKKRVKVAERNLALCFPQMSEQDRALLLKRNIQHAGMAILESSMGWWWPDWRVKRHGEVEGHEHIQAILDKGKGVLGLAIHNMNIELGCRIMGFDFPAVGFYRKHNNPLMEYFQYHGRSRSNKYMIPKKNVGGLIEALNNQEVCLYLPDQDYGRNRSEFAPFFAVPETATTTGTLLFAEQANCEIVFLLSLRNKHGYKVIILPGFTDFPSGDDQADVTRLNRQIEKMVLRAPEQYLWMHKRFKTRPNAADPSLYD